MNKKAKILLLPGDGIGPEVSEELKKIIDCLEINSNISFEVDEDLVGGASYDVHGLPVTENVIAKAKNVDAVILGAVGGEKYDKLPFDSRPERGLLKIRKSLDLFANIRPAKVFNSLSEASSLKKEIVENMDIIVLRELTGGIYFGEPRGIENIGKNLRRGINTEVYQTNEILRLGKVGFEIAKKRKKLIHSVEKANVMETGILWREEINKQGSESFPEIKIVNMYADNCAMQLVRNPKQFDVIVTGNLFGDILSDISAELTGSLGMLPSASLGDVNPEKNKRLALYEPVHGSAPDIAGKNIANPIAMILSFAMFLNHSLDEKKLSEYIENAVENVLNKGYRTNDIMQSKLQQVSTKEMGDLIEKELKIMVSN